jgi:hypothetical protein
VAAPPSRQILSLPPEWTGCDQPTHRCYQDPSLSLSSPASELFGGTIDPAAKLSFVYPLDGAMHPMNSADITFQWHRGQAAAPVVQTIFRIQLHRANGDVFEFFVPCNAPGTAGPSVDDTECIYRMPPGAWLELASTARGETVSAEIAGVDPSHPATYGVSAPLSLSFSPEDVRGGFYYWSSAITGTERLLFGARAPQDYIRHTGNTCGGCHTVSGDGSTIAFEQGDTGSGVLWVAPTSAADTPNFPPAPKHDCGTQALNHDGSRVLVSFSGKLILRETKTGGEIIEVNERQLGLTNHAFHPEWSPDDQLVAVTVSSQGDSDWAVRTGSIGILPYNDGKFGDVDIVVPTGTTPGSDFNFYPTWSPDGHFIVFATGTVGKTTDMPPETSYVQPTAHLRLYDRDTKQIFDLAAASGPDGSTSTWPKFAPFTQAGGLMFLTFNSKRDYGFLLAHNATGAPQLWMTVIDVSKLAQPGSDPSRPPVWLPFQDVRQRNYLSTWAAAVGCRPDGGPALGCGDQQVCQAGVCVMGAP